MSSPAGAPTLLPLLISAISLLLLTVTVAAQGPLPPPPATSAQSPVSPAPPNPNGSAGNLTAAVRGFAPSREFLVAHNKVRASVGERPLRWDRAVARHARDWAARRAADCQMKHSYGKYGENLFWGSRDHWTPTEIVQSWASEDKYYNAQNNACADRKMCGHYTQVVWKDTARLGCAAVKCASGGMFAICSYDPPGNYMDESPFSPSNQTHAGN
ncbi:pathogenesis-related protein 1C [Malania oleifera]|uniref:pathogenesis-related protein 1C n=1 Tax=Malania oleifera TaxID=397392 RepID=UPI0025AEB7CA|nr:pathogenesis-related protein 1C [Malania oleifera]